MDDITRRALYGSHPYDPRVRELAEVEVHRAHLARRFNAVEGDRAARVAREFERERALMAPIIAAEQEHQERLRAMAAGYQERAELIGLARSISGLAARLSPIETAMRPYRAIQEAVAPFRHIAEQQAQWAALSGVSELARTTSGLRDAIHGLAIASPVWSEAQRMAELVSRMQLPSTLASFHVVPERLAERLALMHAPALAGHWTDPAVASGIANASALSRMFGDMGRVNADAWHAASEFRHAGLPGIADVGVARATLDAGGLQVGLFSVPYFDRFILPPLPTKGEKRRALNRMKKRRKPSPLHLRATSQIGTIELTLRDVVSRAMEVTYGPDWVEERLTACGCRGLLGKVRARGGTVLEHADWADYERIMCDPVHFEAVFSVGFDDVEVLRSVLVAVKQDRARALHFNAFTVENLTAVRTSCKALEAGLMELLHPFGLGDDDAEDDDWEVVEN